MKIFLKIYYKPYLFTVIHEHHYIKLTISRRPTEGKSSQQTHSYF